ncbi:hypothetical protein HKX48_005677 [Thoreauomyces humboldtii]|nr:hypothetical protein HKX48_005677 [Thoreauomyces humboldtii]
MAVEDNSSSTVATSSAKTAPSTIVGSRVCVNSHYGTIRFHGPVPHGSPSLWYGIEWDDPSRGKHSGTHDDVVYFHTIVPGSASFLRETKVPQDAFGVSFLAALESKYLAVQPGDSVVRFGGGTGVEVETVGWDKVAKKVAQLGSLREVGLAERMVAGGRRRGQTDRGAIARTCPEIEDLDLSRNLLGWWRDVADICDELVSLRSLRLAHNRFAVVNEDDATRMEGAFPKLKALTLLGTHMPWTEAEAVQKWLPSLDELHFGFNRLATFPTSVVGFDVLRVLNLENNNLSSWTEIRKLAHLPVLATLMLNHNNITTIDPPSSATEFRTLQSLSISDNRIATWSSVHALNAFPALKDVRIRRNPTFEGVSTDDLHSFLVGRLGKLTHINGSLVTPQIRRDAELYYLARCAKDALDLSVDDLLVLHPRYEDLVSEHGAPVVAPASATSTVLKDRVVVVSLVCGQRKARKKIPGNMNVRPLRVMASRMFGLKGHVRLIRMDPEGGEVEMEDDLRDVDFYGLVAGEEIRVE